MSDADRKKIRETNPNLHEAVAKGHLPEASYEFVEVAKQYPLRENK